MNQNQLKRNRITTLNAGKIRDIGVFEKIYLKCIGRMDGKRGLPRENSGQWTSPHIERELHSFDEFCFKTFGRLQIDSEDDYARLGKLMDSIVSTHELLAKAKEEVENAIAGEKTELTSRKKGEEALTSEQVASRRKKEREKRIEPLKSAVAGLENKLSSEFSEFSALRNKILEDNHSTSLICDKIKEHVYQRICVYYNSAFRKHPGKASMPVIPCITIESEAEAVYLQPHKALLERAETLSLIIHSKDIKEVA